MKIFVVIAFFFPRAEHRYYCSRAGGGDGRYPCSISRVLGGIKISLGLLSFLCLS